MCGPNVENRIILSQAEAGCSLFIKFLVASRDEHWRSSQNFVSYCPDCMIPAKCLIALQDRGTQHNTSVPNMARCRFENGTRAFELR